MQFLIALLAGLFLLTGCSDAEKKPAPSTATPPPAAAQKKTASQGTAGTVVDGMTGRSAVRQGKQAMNQVRNVSSNKNDNLNEIMP